MLPKTNRLQKKSEIEKVLKEGKGGRFKEGFLILKLRKNNLEKSRFSFIISQRVSKKASFRNKIRRRLSEIVRLKLKKIKEGRHPPTESQGMDVVLIALPGLETKDFWEIEEGLNRLFSKAKILSDEAKTSSSPSPRKAWLGESMR